MKEEMQNQNENSPCQSPKNPVSPHASAEAQEESKPIRTRLRSLKTQAKVEASREILKNRSGQFHRR
jgi:hypothetical protein